MKQILIGLSLAVLLTGCASNHHAKADTSDASRGATSANAQTSDDAKIVRGIVDSLASPANRVPSNIPK